MKRIVLTVAAAFVGLALMALPAAAEGTPAEVRASKEPYVQHFLSMWFEKQ